jgi:aryl-alcohol dehydrogenase-like predicted oxidoreductase
MEILQQQGKIRYWGFHLIRLILSLRQIFFIQHKNGNGFQLVLNILNQKALPIIKDAKKNGYGVIARMPLQFGLLTGKFDHGVSFSANDHRKTD